MGPPGDSPALTGSLAVASLGPFGSAVLEWTDTVIEDRAGPDFTVFENAFFVGAAPTGPGDDFVVFAEPAKVEVSEDGFNWYAFAYDEDAAADAGSQPVDRALWTRLRGLAGVSPTATGNWTLAEDPELYGPEPGGLEGAGGDAFDLAESGMTAVRFVRITDLGSANGAAGAGEGFDLDAVVVHHGRPVALPAAVDSDADGLTDLAETEAYGTNPVVADSDGDGVDDGRELAGCRDPNSFDLAPRFPAPGQLRLDRGSCTEFRWAFAGSGALYDLLSAPLAAAVPAGGNQLDWGSLSCLADDVAPNHWGCDDSIPLPGEALVYWVAPSDGSELGYGSDWRRRTGSGGCP